MAEAVATADPVEEPRKSKTLLIVLIVVVLLAAVGGGAAFYLSKSKPATDAATAKDAKDASHKGPALYVSLDPPFVVNFEAGQAVRFLQVTVQVMTRDAQMQTMIKENDPVLRNNLLMLFGNQKYETVSTREGKEDLRKQALEVVRKAIAEEGGKPDLVEAVLFTSLVMQ
jgi:flagellar FliL protein